MSEIKIAKRYANSYINLAIEKKILEQTKNDILLFNEVCNKNKDFVNFLNSPIIHEYKKISIVNAIFKNKVHDITLMFFNLIIKKKREKYLPQIASQFIVLYNAQMGIQKAEVITTFKLDNHLKSEFEKVVNKLYNKKSEIIEKVDTSILGGFILKVDGQQIDESLSGKLNQIKLSFKNN